MMRRQVRLLYVAVAAFVIIAVGTVISNRLDDDIARLKDITQEVMMEKIQVDTEKSKMLQEISQSDSATYIMEMARRSYEYLLPGEIRFVVVNAESLYDTEPEAEIVDDAMLQQAGAGG